MEHWLPAPGYEGIYSVSDLGRVRIEVRRHNIQKGTILAQTPYRDGYLCVTLRRDHELRGKALAVGRIVLTTFVGPPPEPAMQANHGNGDITDNRLTNLEWATPKENTLHAIDVLGMDRRGASNPAARLTEEQVVEIRESAARGETYAALGERFGISNVMACNIARGVSWKHVGGPITKTRPKGRPPSK